MSKQTRKQRKEEEQRVLAEMEEALKENAEKSESEETEKPKKGAFELFKDKTPEILHCRRCKTQMENGVCPSCGFRVYVPMDKEKQKKIRWILGGVCIAGLLIFYILSQLL